MKKTRMLNLVFFIDFVRKAFFIDTRHYNDLMFKLLFVDRRSKSINC